MKMAKLDIDGCRQWDRKCCLEL